MSTKTLQTDTVDVADFARTLHRGWHMVVLGVMVGLMMAVAVLLFVPPRFKATSSIVIRAAERAASVMAAAALGGGSSGGGGGGGMSGGGGSIADAASSLLPDALGGSSIETDVQILQSRALAGQAVDSLRLQARIKSKQRRAPWQAFQSLAFTGAFKRKSLHFMRPDSGGTYRITGWGPERIGHVGEPVSLPGGTLVLANAAPAEFSVDLFDREEATTRFIKRLDVSKDGGEVVSVSYSADDSLTAAAAPNLVVRRYLDYRKTTDRGVNERRAEFLALQADSAERALAENERLLRQEQEATGVIDPSVVGRLDLQRVGALRTSAGELDLERGAISQLLSQLAAGQLTSRELAAYPTFLKSSAVNDLLSQLSILETKRLELLATFTPEAPEVIAATEGIKNIENQLAPLARTYQVSLDRQHSDLVKQIDTLQQSIASLPATSELAARRQRDVLRLAQISTALRAQLVDAKLAAIAEGGDVRPLDVAMAPRKISFPTKALTLAAGGAGGLLLGFFLAVMAGAFGRYVRDPYTIERQVGVPALALEEETPLLLAGTQPIRTVLLVPLDGTADTGGVAERVVRSAVGRGLTATILDLSQGGIAGNGTGPLATLQNEFDVVAVRLPKLASDATLGALGEDRPVVFVASAGRVDRRELASNVETLRRFGVSCAGVVFSRQPARTFVRLG